MSRCPECKNEFVQPFCCATCGAQKLYDQTLRTAEQRAELAEAQLKDALKLLAEARKGRDEATVVVPREATLSMHNAAAFSNAYKPPYLELCENGTIRIRHGAPDWTKVYRVMLAAAPREGKT